LPIAKKFSKFIFLQAVIKSMLCVLISGADFKIFLTLDFEEQHLKSNVLEEAQIIFITVSPTTY
jgi:hypothetical protein